MKLVFLDEFGHDGFFVSRDHEKHYHSPVFGLSGFIMEKENLYGFLEEFENLLAFYHQRNSTRKKKGIKTEVKGSNAFPAISRNPRHKNFFNAKQRNNIIYKAKRVITALEKHGGQILFYGFEKYVPEEDHNATDTHIACVRALTKRIDKSCRGSSCEYLMSFDDHTNHRSKLKVIRSIVHRKNMSDIHIVDRPYSLQSDLHSCIQVSDWICTLLARCISYQLNPKEWPENKPYQENLWELIQSTATDYSEFKPRQATLVA